MALDEWMAFAAELGLDGVECSPVLIQPLGRATPAEYRRLAEANGLAVSSLTSYSDFTQPDAAAREREVAAMLKNVRLARELGAPLVRALTGQRRPDVDRERGIAWVVDCVRRVAEEADRVGVTLVVENHTKAFVWTDFDFAMRGEVFVRVMDALRDTSARVLFDIGNPLVAGEETLPLFERVKERIAAVHVSDVRRPGVFEFVPIGTGIAPVAEVLKRLRRLGFDGWVGLEEASRTGKDGFWQAVRFTRQAWDSA